MVFKVDPDRRPGKGKAWGWEFRPGFWSLLCPPSLRGLGWTLWPRSEQGRGTWRCLKYSRVPRFTVLILRIRGAPWVESCYWSLVWNMFSELYQNELFLKFTFLPDFSCAWLIIGQEATIPERWLLERIPFFKERVFEEISPYFLAFPQFFLTQGDERKWKSMVWVETNLCLCYKP